ncbi:OLC1v1029612C1 [Oldenlandia corymbosa var. corymbosa]|uniref:OLC1v1029612C1 n=1 Tax=Oldenlandia corymbosa var. corymbosa TaxID=529605 RepID=A0AAV1CHB1_OLDCO|nr:OLC1v1029612C1 [Oldenlandia corymbosa var. corymbosa]
MYTTAERPKGEKLSENSLQEFRKIVWNFWVSQFDFEKMQRGTLEVLLVNAKGLENTDFLNNMDPYVTISYRSQEHKSSVASGGSGSEPEWNETFKLSISESEDDPELLLKILDSDAGEDDFVGEAKIAIEPVFEEGSIPVTTYSVVKDEEFKGEIRVGLTFTPQDIDENSAQEESYGGWKESALE